MFPTGQMVLTRGINDKVAGDTNFAKFVWDSIKRHIRGDWGDLGNEDKEENELALKEGFVYSLLTKTARKRYGLSRRPTGQLPQFFSRTSTKMVASQ